MSEGYHVIGFDIEPQPLYRGDVFMQQDVLTLHGSQFKDAAVIVGSSPCQEFSYRSLPFKACKNLPPPELGMRLFHAQFRIQREASEAAGHHIPMVVENVRGAQPWVGRAAWHYGSYYLWGDVPALMPFTKGGVKVPGMNWSGSDKPGYKAQAFNTTAEQRIRADGVKLPENGSARRWDQREIPRLNAVNKHEDGYTVAVEDAVKSGGDWFGSGKDASEQRKHGSHSAARKAATAQISKIPFELARYIAHVYKPVCA